MFRNIALAAALALTASIGIAHAEGETANGHESLQQLRDGLVFAPTMSGIGARAVVTPGNTNLTVVYDGRGTRILAHGGQPRVVTDGNGSYHTVYGG
jgi:hypothetical protein